ncbi:Caffeoyl-CoA O-methyltransferase [Plasmodiophora brassicae]|uniref:Caffeoyl-CoA O-methyltransferase n=1 Tax=Plasmodiophora brassicae TaxID=37360 RepID=A0A0G4IUW6_PLABS|nr:hypothetical protein PBRA_007010 [Plasmodiophora brassicae]SPQ92967.1 unnamed protein product [Plasmodiophora brassicae]
MVMEKGTTDAKAMTFIVGRTMVEDPVLAECRDYTQSALNKASPMLLSPDVGQFLKTVAALTNAKNVIEIGTFTGYSTLAMAQALPDDGRIVAMDVSKEFTDVGKRFWKKAKVDHKINLVLGPALDTLRELNADPKNAGAFDLAFIDADKVNYPNYYEALLPLLCKRGTIICDNMMWSMKVANPAITDPDTNGIRALHDRIVKDPRVVASTLNFSDGITMIVKL